MVPCDLVCDRFGSSILLCHQQHEIKVSQNYFHMPCRYVQRLACDGDVHENMYLNNTFHFQRGHYCMPPETIVGTIHNCVRLLTSLARSNDEASIIFALQFQRTTFCICSNRSRVRRSTLAAQNPYNSAKHGWPRRYITKHFILPSPKYCSGTTVAVDSCSA